MKLVQPFYWYFCYTNLAHHIKQIKNKNANSKQSLFRWMLTCEEGHLWVGGSTPRDLPNYSLLLEVGTHPQDPLNHPH